MTHLVDTDWVIDHFHGVDSVTRKLDELRPAGLAISIVFVGRIVRGHPLLARFLTGVTVLRLDEEVCDRFGLERGRLRQRRVTVDDFDLLIAATCLHHNLTLCSNNRRHFAMVEGLEIISAARRQRNGRDQGERVAPEISQAHS